LGKVNRTTGASNNDALDIRIADAQPEAQPLPAERLAPHSVLAEEAVLGSALYNGQVISELSAFLKAEDFFILKHSRIWDVLLAIFERGEAVDELTVIQELQMRAQLEEVGGPAFITRLIVNTPTYIHAETYGRLVERAAVRRRLIAAASEIAQAAQDETADLNQIITRAESTLFGVTERQAQRDLLPIQAALNDYYERIEYHYDHRDEPIGLPTGFNDLDELLAGVQRSDLLIVAARPGVGKTSFLLSMALNAARLGNARVGIFSLEMSSEQLVQRLISSETGINAQKLRSGNLDDTEWSRFTQATLSLAELPIFLDDSPGLSPMALRAKCRRLSREHGLDLVIVDYLQLMESGQGRSDNRVQEVGYISRHLKEMARELNVPLISAAQLSRQVEQRTDKRPQLSDLRESGCLTGDTLVYLPDVGHSVPIQSLVGKTGFRVLSLNPETWKQEAALVTNAFPTGCKPVYRLTTRLGRTIRATANHKFLTIGGWKRLDELMIGETVSVPRQLAYTSGSNMLQTMTDQELGLLGHLIGDGCTLPSHVVQYTTREIDLAELVSSLAIQIFGSTISPRICAERDWYQVYLPASYRLTHNRQTPVALWLSELGVWGLRSYEKHVPRKVFEQPAHAIACFIRHLWATDGCIRINGNYPSVYYASSSNQLANDVQTLLLRLGINACLRRSPQIGKGRDQFHIVISGNEELNRFVEVVGAVGTYKHDSLNEVSTYVNSHAANPNRDIIPNVVWRSYAVPSMQKYGITTRQMQASLGNAYCGTGLYKQNLSRTRAKKLAQIVQSDTLSRLSESDVYWDAITAIVPDGEADVYDLTVPAFSNFVADNIVVHNSIEQDADVIMFIYRDELYNEQSERPNQADIIVAKHRNGPTGVVTLHFNKALTKFGNLKRETFSLND